MAEPNVTSAVFQEPDANAIGGPWVLSIVVQGDGFVARGMPLTATVGDVPVQSIFLYPDATGFSGLLDTLPADGAVLSVGYEQVLATDVVYQAGAVA
jgi:hypothetical protein